VKHRLKTLSRTSWWESASTRVVIEHDWNCGLVLTSLRSVAHAGVIRKNREKEQFITGAAPPKEEETKEKEKHEVDEKDKQDKEDKEDKEEDKKQREGHVQQEENYGRNISTSDNNKNQESDGNGGNKTDKDSSPFSSTDLEHLGCAYVDCVGAVDHMIMMESYFDHMKAEGKRQPTTKDTKNNKTAPAFDGLYITNSLYFVFF
jgi:hypothetical protein